MRPPQNDMCSDAHLSNRTILQHCSLLMFSAAAMCSLCYLVTAPRRAWPKKRCGFCGKRVSLQRKETSLHRGTLESFHKLLGRKNATPEVHAQLMSIDAVDLSSGVDAVDHFLSLTLPESVTKPAAASEHQTQRVLSSFP